MKGGPWVNVHSERNWVREARGMCAFLDEAGLGGDWGRDLEL